MSFLDGRVQVFFAPAPEAIYEISPVVSLARGARSRNLFAAQPRSVRLSLTGILVVDGHVTFLPVEDVADRTAFRRNLFVCFWRTHEARYCNTEAWWAAS